MRHVPPSTFYVTLIDSLGEHALIQDFQAWEVQTGCVLVSHNPLLLDDRC